MNSLFYKLTCTSDSQLVEIKAVQDKSSPYYEQRGRTRKIPTRALLGWIYLQRVIVPFPNIVKNLLGTCRKLLNKEEPYWKQLLLIKYIPLKYLVHF